METWKFLLCLLASQLTFAQDCPPTVRLNAGLGTLLGDLPLTPSAPCLPPLPLGLGSLSSYADGCLPPLPCLPNSDFSGDIGTPSLPNLATGDCGQNSGLPSLPSFLPSLPSNLPSIPSSLASLPSSLPSLPSFLPPIPPIPPCLPELPSISQPACNDGSGYSDYGGFSDGSVLSYFGPQRPDRKRKLGCAEKCAQLKAKCALLKAKCNRKLQARKSCRCDKKLPLCCLKKGITLGLGPGSGAANLETLPCGGSCYDDYGR